MDNYFTSVIGHLSLEEIELLNLLTSSESTNRYSAQTKKELLQKSKLTEANFRKIMTRLEAMNLIEIVTGNKDHLVFVNEYGQNAIQYIYERSNA